MGRIQDRTVERLGVSDRAVTANRRLLLRAIDALEAGQAPRRAGRSTRRRRARSPGRSPSTRSPPRPTGRTGMARPGGASAELARPGPAGCVAWTSARSPRRVGGSARPMLAADRARLRRRATSSGTTPQYAAAAQLRRVVDELGIELVRVAFADQHGVLHGKTADPRGVRRPRCARGVTAPSSLLLKDTVGHARSYPVFDGDTGARRRRARRARATSCWCRTRHVPRAAVGAATPAWLLCDLHFPDGAAGAVLPRRVLRDRAGPARAASGTS